MGIRIPDISCRRHPHHNSTSINRIRTIISLNLRNPEQLNEKIRFVFVKKCSHMCKIRHINNAQMKLRKPFCKKIRAQVTADRYANECEQLHTSSVLFICSQSVNRSVILFHFAFSYGMGLGSVQHLISFTFLSRCRPRIAG